MKKVVGVRFKPAGKIYNFDSGSFVLKQGESVIVETEQGMSLGTVASIPVECDENSLKIPLKKVYRPAGNDDFMRQEKNYETETRAYDYCLKCIDELGLKMNLFTVESKFDASKLTFFFTAEGRVDFRELVKMLVKEFRTRIEMRQVGIRNQAKMCGGLGRCGREICCSAFLEKFEPVSIRMAKRQSLSLNPTKISGQCGRLMCCLTYENKTYKKIQDSLPKIGKSVILDGETGKVVRHNVIRGRVIVRFSDGRELEVEPDKIIVEKVKKEEPENTPKPKPKPRSKPNKQKTEDSDHNPDNK